MEQEQQNQNAATADNVCSCGQLQQQHYQNLLPGLNPQIQQATEQKLPTNLDPTEQIFNLIKSSHQSMAAFVEQVEVNGLIYYLQSRILS